MGAVYFAYKVGYNAGLSSRDNPPLQHISTPKAKVLTKKQEEFVPYTKEDYGNWYAKQKELETTNKINAFLRGEI